MDPGEAITIEYEFTRDDYVRWTVWLRTQGEAARQWRAYAKWYGFLVTATALLTLLMAAAWVNDWRAIVRAEDPWLVMMMVTLTGVTFLCFTYARQLHQTVGEAAIARGIQKDADSERGRLWQGHKRVTVSPSLLIWEARHCVFLHRWWRIRAIRKDGWFVHLDMGGEGGWPIPLHVFGDEAGADRFIALANMYRTAAPGGPREEMRDLLRDRDVKCAGCGYNLRGSGGEKCPECGRKVELGEVLGRET
jgi:hypothetical protein